MPSVTEELLPPEVCTACGYAHLYDDDERERKNWVTQQHAVGRWTGKNIRAATSRGEFRQGDIIIDRDGDTLMLWGGYWMSDPYLRVESRKCNFVTTMDSNLEDEEGEQDMQFEPYGFWWQHTFIKEVPKFRTPEEAEAWLSANAR
jgi:hypothetical protein